MKRFFQLLKSKLSSRGVLVALGLITVGCLVWFGGPIIAIAGHTPLAGVAARLATLLVIVLVWGANNFRLRLKEKRANQDIMESIVEDDDAENEHANTEISQLRERLQQALLTLKSTRLNGRKTLYQLPWYMLIGAPGSGKSTALLNSGLRFPLRESMGVEALEGIGGTRNCDWWFTDKAVLLDTAGRYTTQDSRAEQDKKAWNGFLGLLRKYRPKRPVNGVIVTVSLEDLASQTATERGLHARAIKQRIQELNNQLGLRTPVYLLLTKADLISGFREYFHDLSQEEREQIFGVTLPFANQDNLANIDHFNEEYLRLLQRLELGALPRIDHERDIDSRALIQGFPRQLRLLQGPVDELARAIFAPNRYEEPPLLRGIYIVSASQSGVPVNRMLKQLNNELGIRANHAPGFDEASAKGFFLRNLFDRVIFQESNVATLSQSASIRNKRVAMATYAAAGVLLCGSVAAWTQSYHRNMGTIQAVNQQAHAIRKLNADTQGGPDLVQLTRLLTLLRQLPYGFAQGADAKSWQEEFGLFQGDKLGQASDDAYERALKNLFLPYLAKRLATRLEDPDNNFEYEYETLKTYLMLHEPRHFDPDQIEAWFQLDWERNWPGKANQKMRQQLSDHLAELVKRKYSLPNLNRQVVADARRQLNNMPLAERAYRVLKQEYANDKQLPAFHLSDVLDAQTMATLVAPDSKPKQLRIPGLFTYNGFHGIFQTESRKLADKLSKESWVYGKAKVTQLSQADTDRLRKAVRKRYFTEYIYRWKHLLAALQPKAFHSTAQGRQLLGVIDGPDEPLQRVLKVVRKNVELTKVPKIPNAGKDLPQGASARLSSKKAQLAQFMPKGGIQGKVHLPGKEVESAFKDEIQLTDNLAKPQSDMGQALALAAGVQQNLNRIANAQDGGKVSYATLQRNNRPSQQLAKVAKRLPAPARQWFEQIAGDTESVLVAGAHHHLNRVWRNKVYHFYAQAIAHRYPVDPKSRNAATLKDFASFFGPKGVVSSYFDNYLKPFVDTSGRHWRWTTNLGFGHQALVMFQRANTIRKAMFQDGSDMPSVHFSLKPLMLDTRINQFTLSVNNQQLTYRHGPPQAKSINWPGKQTFGSAAVSFTPPGGMHPLTHSLDGPWAWFRLLDESDLKRSHSPQRYKVVFSYQGHQAAYQLIAQSVVNAFHLPELEHFRCPRTL